MSTGFRQAEQNLWVICGSMASSRSPVGIVTMAEPRGSSSEAAEVVTGIGIDAVDEDPEEEEADGGVDMLRVRWCSNGRWSLKEISNEAEAKRKMFK